MTALLCSTSVAWANDIGTGKSSDTADSIVVVAGKVDAHAIAGSASLLDEAALAAYDYADVNRVLRQVPGINIQEEEGFGLFPNIGLRGTPVERSGNITLMEDGVLIAPAPYAAPSAYYFPSVGRMSAVEVVNGAAAVRYGPRTIGGAINFRSTPIPDGMGGNLSAQYGEDDFYVVHANVGLSGEHFGGVIETFQSGSDGFKQLDGGGNTGFEREDFLIKLRAGTGDDFALPMSLEFKYAAADTDAEETYLGLSDADFAATPYRRYAASQQDRFASKHDQYMLTHSVEIGEAKLVTTGYINEFSRNWHKLDSFNASDGRGFISPQTVFDTPGTAQNIAALALLGGETDSAPAAFRVRNNNRTYDSRGVQSTLTMPFTFGGSEHTIVTSLRYHEDEEDRLQHDERFQMLNGRLVLTSTDSIGSNANRESKAEATAFYIEDTIQIGALTLSPGLRHESIDLTRLDYGSADPTRANGPTNIRKSKISVWLPAFGITYDLDNGIRLLGSISRGFAPPAPGQTDAVEEKSWNYELGARYASDNWNAALIGFFNDYSNLLGSCTNAAGCNTGDIGDQFNGGKVDVKGIEASVAGDIPFGQGLHIPLRANYTLTDAKFKQDFASDFFGNVVKGDALPYIPRHQMYVSGGLASETWLVTMSANYVSAVRTEAGTGPIPMVEKVPARTIFDLAGRFAINDMIGVFARVDNLFDKNYAVARRPVGLRPGKPQTFIGGIEARF